MKLAAFAVASFAALAAPARASDEPSDPRALLQGAVEKLIELQPMTSSVTVAGFAGEGGRSLCAAALTEALLVALDEEARHPNRMLRDRPLAVRRGGVAAAGAGAVLATGRLEVDQRGRAMASLSFRQDAAVLAPTGLVPLALDRLGCDPIVRPFLQHVAAGARLDRERLDMAAPAFAMGQRLEIGITLRRPQRLFCWVLAEDGTGAVALPTARGGGALKPGLLRYPRDFGLDDIVLSARFENVFACFGAEGDVPEPLLARWMALAPTEGRDAPVLDAATVDAVMGEWRATPGVSEATARIVVR
jgi:hypothetical protein